METYLLSHFGRDFAFLLIGFVFGVLLLLVGIAQKKKEDKGQKNG